MKSFLFVSIFLSSVLAVADGLTTFYGDEGTEFYQFQSNLNPIVDVKIDEPRVPEILPTFDFTQVEEAIENAPAIPLPDPLSNEKSLSGKIRALIFPFFDVSKAGNPRDHFKYLKNFGNAMPASMKTRPSDPYGPVAQLDGVKLTAVPNWNSATSGKFQVQELDSKKTEWGTTLSFDLKKKRYILDNNSKPFTNLLVIQGPEDSAQVEWAVRGLGRRTFEYRGNFVITAEKTPTGYTHIPSNTLTIKVVNVVSMEEWVASVIPGEFPARFAETTQRAGAIAIRSHGTDGLITNRMAGLGQDVVSGTQNALYMGSGRKTEVSVRAAQATANKVRVNRGRIILGFFSANCGGQSVDYSDYDPGHHHKEYLVSVKEWYPDVLRRIKNSGTHKRTVSKQTFLQELNHLGVGFTDGTILSLTPTDFNSSNRATALIVQGPRTTLKITGDKFRRFCADIGIHPYMAPGKAIQDTVEFEYYGIGHGVGLCQEGANTMAIYGRPGKKNVPVTDEDILNFYYPHTQTVDFDKSLAPSLDGQEI